MTLEREIYSIESANINKETLDAMKNAGAAMKQIHGGMTIEDVDKTMYVDQCFCSHILIRRMDSAKVFAFVVRPALLS